MKNIGKFVLITVLLFIFPQFILPCSFVNEKPTNPCVLLTNGQRGCFLLFCKDATLVPDLWNRAIPRPCSEITNYQLHNDFQLILGVPENRVEYYTSFGSHVSPVALTMLPYICNINTVDIQPDLVNFPLEEEFVKPGSEGFLGNTEVLTSAQEVRLLESLEIGDKLLAYDLQTQSFKETLVININKIPAAIGLVKIRIGQNWVTCGPAQKFYLSESKKWVCAKDLKPGDRVYKRRLDECLGTTEIVQIIVETESKQQTVAITLEQYHNFCTADGIIVHNCMYTVVAGAVVPLVWDFAAAALSDTLVGQSLPIPSSLYPKHFREFELEKSSQKSQTASRELGTQGPFGQPFYGSNQGLTQTDETKRNAQRTFGEVEYQYYQRNAQRLTLGAQLLWEPYRKMLADQRHKVSQIAREKRNIVLSQTEELYKSLVQKARARALDLEQNDVYDEDKVEVLSDNCAGSSPEGPKLPKCINNDPNALSTKLLEVAFDNLIDTFSSIVQQEFVNEIPLLQNMLKGLESCDNQAFIRMLKTGIEKVKNCIEKFPKRSPVTVEALGKISGPGKDLLAGSKSTDKFYPYAQGPSRIYMATKNIKKWNLTKGDYFYMDYSHRGDHIEVFHRDGAKDKFGNDISRQAKDVRNFDGSRNHNKRKSAFGWTQQKDKSWIFRKRDLRSINDFVNQKFEN